MRIFQMQRYSAIALVIDIVFLFFVLLHALTGAYMVLTDIERVNVYKRALAILAVVIGIGAFIYGVQTIMAFQPPG